MTATRDFAFSIPMSREKATIAADALSLLRRHDEKETLSQVWAKVQVLDRTDDASLSELFPSAPDKTPPDVIGFGASLMRSIGDSLASSGRQLALLDWSVQEPDPELSPSLLLWTQHEGWVYRSLVISIIEACQGRLDAGPAGLVHDDDVDGERRHGAVFVAPGKNPEYFDLDSWVQEKVTSHTPSPSSPSEPTPEAG